MAGGGGEAWSTQQGGTGKRGGGQHTVSGEFFSNKKPLFLRLEKGGGRLRERDTPECEDGNNVEMSSALPKGRTKGGRKKFIVLGAKSVNTFN